VTNNDRSRWDYKPEPQRLEPVTLAPPLWTLTKNGHTATAHVKAIDGVGLELRFMIDGELRHSQIFRDWPSLEQAAEEKRGDFEGEGLGGGRAVSFSDEERAELIAALSRAADMVAGLLDALDLLRVALEAGRQPTEGDLQRLREHSALWAPATREAALTSQRDDDRTADKGAVNCVQSETSPRPCRPLHLRPQDPQCQYSTLSCVKLSLTDGSLPASAQRLQTGGVRGICTAIVISDMVEPDGRGDVERLLPSFHGDRGRRGSHGNGERGPASQSRRSSTAVSRASRSSVARGR